MKLYIAEKPSLARALVDVLPKPHRKCNGYIQCGEQIIVSWCIGHLLEQAEPDAYDPRYKQWKLNDLPIVPRKWLLLPKPETKKQLSILIKLIQSAETIYHVGDPDREGQLLIDEVLNYSQLSAEKNHKVKRCLINDLNEHAVLNALDDIRNNYDYAPLSTSALARSRADWLYGMNMSRLCTIKGQQCGYKGVLSVGRVQTPVLGLVVRRDLEIEHFKPKPFYEVFAHLQTTGGDTFKAKWLPSEACEPYQDELGRILLKALAQNVVDRVTNKLAIVDKVETKKRELASPLPFNLSSLQIEMARKHQLSAQQVLDICQTLYEKYKLITYPRSDCRYLPEVHFHQAEAVMEAISVTCPSLQPERLSAVMTLSSKCWNDKKVNAHHAIIPTLRKVQWPSLNKQQQYVYKAIALHYICQFYPAHRFAEQQIDVLIEGGRFVSKTTKVMVNGWKDLFNAQQTKDNNTQFELKNTLQKGDKLHCPQGELVEKETQPPKYFTDATLLSAMTGIARFVKESEIKKVLRETDGLGTEATRAGIIELLFKRKFLLRQGRQIKATEMGRQFILSLPEKVTTPDMTALWESQLLAISKREKSYQAFIQQMEVLLTELIVQIKPTSFQHVSLTDT